MDERRADVQNYTQPIGRATESGGRMTMPKPSQLRILVTTVCAIMTASFSLHAQQLGHYLQGAAGLGSGSPLPSGVYVTYLPYVSFFQSFRGPDGGKLAVGDFTSAIQNVQATYMTKQKIFGAEFGMGVLAPFVNTRLTGERLPISTTYGGFSDLYVTPVILGWRRARYDVVANYSFVAPTGDFDPASTSNPGLGFWSHIAQVGSSFGLDKTRTWNGTVMSSWEVATRKKGVDVHVGPGLTFEYALGRRFQKGLGNLGVAGAYFTKLQADSGSAINPLLKGNRDRLMSLGPELQYIVPQWKLAFLARYEQQFGVANRLQGNVLFVAITYMHPRK